MFSEVILLSMMTLLRDLCQYTRGINLILHVYYLVTQDMPCVVVEGSKLSN